VSNNLAIVTADHTLVDSAVINALYSCRSQSREKSYLYYFVFIFWQICPSKTSVKEGNARLFPCNFDSSALAIQRCTSANQLAWPVSSSNAWLRVRYKRYASCVRKQDGDSAVVFFVRKCCSTVGDILGCSNLVNRTLTVGLWPGGMPVERHVLLNRRGMLHIVKYLRHARC
jgi:hypothetical protein